MWLLDRSIEFICDKFDGKISAKMLLSMQWGQRGSRGIASVILNLSRRWKWMLNCMLWLFNPRGRDPFIHLTEGWVSTRASSFGGLEVVCWPLVPKFVGTNPAEAVGFFRVKKSLACLHSGGKWSRRSHVIDLWHVKDPWKLRESRAFQAKFIGHFSPT
jgi:hypothetical protein